MNESSRREVLEELRTRAREIWNAALAAADPAAAVHRALLERPFEPVAEWELLAVGKAAGAMARAALEGAASDQAPRGLVVTEASQASKVASALESRGFSRIPVESGGHPLPDQGSVRAAAVAEALVSGSRSPLLVLLSGGGSALLAAPSSGLSLEDQVATTSLLQAAGADIGELNCVRRHLSRVKGGGLGRRAEGREVRVLVLSDVIGDSLEDVASGPFFGDSTSFADARQICQLRGIEATIPVAVVRHLEAGARGELEENPEPQVLEWIAHQVVGSLTQSVEAAAREAAKLGWAVERLPEWLVGEARTAGANLARKVLEAAPGAEARAWIGGGETVVTVTGDGVGGRAQELALTFAAAAEGRLEAPWTMLSAGTDGRDGPGAAAGAIVDSETLSRARRVGYEAQEVLERNDASSLLEASGDLVTTGPTGTNVGDVVVLLEGAGVAG